MLRALLRPRVAARGSHRRAFDRVPAHASAWWSIRRTDAFPPTGSRGPSARPGWSVADGIADTLRSMMDERNGIPAVLLLLLERLLFLRCQSRFLLVLLGRF